MALNTAGITLELTWAETGTGTKMVIERDTDGAFPSSVVVVTLSNFEASYYDELPLSSTTYYYRAKHTKTGEADSAWSSTVSDVPQEA